MSNYDFAHHFNKETGFSLLIDAVYWVVFYMVSSYFVAYLIIPKLLIAKNYVFVIFFFLAGSYFICVFIRIFCIYVLEPIIRKPLARQESIHEIFTDIPSLIGNYFIPFFFVAWVFGFFKSFKDQYLVQQRALLLEKEKTETELKVLKTQLNPHFLFNTLNNIYSLSLVSSPVTSKSIAGLAEILDHVLYHCNDAYVPISTEITLLKNYIGLEKLRYDERLQVIFEHSIDEDLQIAPLILLSLVENAFKHGAGEDDENPIISINLQLVNKQFRFMVSNTFVSHKGEIRTHQIGLSNVKKQLELIYPGNYEFHVSSNDEIYTVVLMINLIS